MQTPLSRMIERWTYNQDIYILVQRGNMVYILLRELECPTTIFILVLLQVTTTWLGLANLSVSVSVSSSAKWERLSYRIAKTVK